MNTVLNKEQIYLIEQIDNKLNILLSKMDYDDYLNFLNNDDYMSTYDHVLGYYEVNYFPEAFLSGLTNDFLNKVLNRVEDKIKELKLEGLEG